MAVRQRSITAASLYAGMMIENMSGATNPAGLIFVNASGATHVPLPVVARTADYR